MIEGPLQPVPVDVNSTPGRATATQNEVSAQDKAEGGSRVPAAGVQLFPSNAKVAPLVSMVTQKELVGQETHFSTPPVSIEAGALQFVPSGDRSSLTVDWYTERR